MAGYETCRENLSKLLAWYKPRIGQRNEATTRLHLIDKIFFDCLGWEIEDVTVEEIYEGQYTDYSFFCPRRVLIIEAKKEGDYFELPAGCHNQVYSITSLFRDYPNLKKAIVQVAQYCQTRGVKYGVVCNGTQIVMFVATRSDGIPPFEGKSIVFSSLNYMLDNFFDFWNILSKPGIERGYVDSILIGDILPDLPPKLSNSISVYPGSKDRNVFQTDLQIVSDLVLEDIIKTRDLEVTFLRECYCQSGALSQYSRISKSILKARYAALFEPDQTNAVTIPASGKTGISGEILAESLSRRPIILLGDVGVGKSAFILYLTKVDSDSLFDDDAITLLIDLGSQASLTTDIREYVVKEISSQLRINHNIEIEENSFVRGVYNFEIERFRKSIYKDLFSTKPDLYKEKELEFLEGKIKNKEDHLKNSLEHVSKARKKQIIIFLDNADQRDDNTQQLAFLIAQEFAERWPATVFLCLRPDTYNRSLRTGTLSGYHPKVFTISPPRVDQVITKRLAFALRITSGEIALSSLPQELHLKLSKLDSIIRVFLYSLEHNRNLIQFIDNISNGNIRLALNLVKGFFGSGHVDTQKIIRIYEAAGSYHIPLHEFLHSVIYGDCAYYTPDQSILANIFDISRVDYKEHFLLPLLIGLLMSSKDTSAREGFVETKKVYERCQGLGFLPEQIDFAINRACRKKLIETSGRCFPESGSAFPFSLRATTMGAYHIEDLCWQFSYIDAIIVDTPILDNSIREKIHNENEIQRRLARTEILRKYLDGIWQELHDCGSLFNWSGISQKLKSQMEKIRISLL